MNGAPRENEGHEKKLISGREMGRITIVDILLSEWSSPTFGGERMAEDGKPDRLVLVL